MHRQSLNKRGESITSSQIVCINSNRCYSGSLSESLASDIIARSLRTCQYSLVARERESGLKSLRVAIVFRRKGQVKLHTHTTSLCLKPD